MRVSPHLLRLALLVQTVLLPSAHSRCEACDFVNMYSGTCGVLSIKSDCWLSIDDYAESDMQGSDSEWCCASNPEDCCEPNKRVITGMLLTTATIIIGKFMITDSVLITMILIPIMSSC